MILKYQLVPEDLDALVSVRSDADLKHMFDEHDRHVGGAPMLRAFLFPSKPVVLENQATVSEPQMLEQRYIDAINGIIHTGPSARRSSPLRAVSSACSSPKSKSPDGHSVDPIHESFFRGNRLSMHRVRSSPSISSLNNLQSHSNGSLSNQQHDHNYHHHQNHIQHHPHGHPSTRLSPDPQIGTGFGRPPPILSLVRIDNGRGNNSSNHYYQTGRNSNGHKGSPGYFKCGHHDESSPSGNIRFERNNSAPRPS